MKKFTYDFAISEETEKDADYKMQSLTKLASMISPADLSKLIQSNLPALVIMASGLSRNELDKLAYMLKNDPIKTAMAKKALGV